MKRQKAQKKRLKISTKKLEHYTDVLEDETTPIFYHRYRSDFEMSMTHSARETNSILTLLMTQFNKNHKNRIDNETVFYGISAVKNGIDDMNDLIATVKDKASIKDASATTIMLSTIEEMSEKTKSVLELLFDQFCNDEDGCLNNKTIYAIFESVRKDVTKMANVAQDFFDLIEKQHA